MTLTYKPGRYLCRITAQYFGEPQKTSRLKFCLWIKILENLDDPVTPCRQLIREINEWLIPRNVVRVVQDLRALGYPGNDLSGLDPDRQGFHDFFGQEVEVLCVHEPEEDGRLWERWKLCGPPRNLQDKSQLLELDRLLTGDTDAKAGQADSDDSDEDLPL
jgi:hypothetical protein